ncbi:MAG TPA: EAL domain-containing protein, partial [Chloroflexota bacterium]|nr:EAL domain-containing protein [Chloroflexota bacterium]
LDDLSERESLTDHLRRCERQILAQQTIIRLLAEAESLDDATPDFLEAMARHGEWDIAAFWGVDTSRPGMSRTCCWCAEGAASAGLGTDSAQGTVRCGEGIVDDVWRSAAPHWIEDVATDFRSWPRPDAAQAQAPALRSACYVPVVFDGRVRSVIELASRNPRTRDEEQIASLVALATLVGRFFERERADEAIRASEERYRTITEIAHDAVITIDETSRILSANPAAERVFGYSLDELIGRSLTMLMPDGMREAHRAGMRRYLTGGRRHLHWESLELPAIHQSGREILIEISLGEFSEGARRTFTGFIRDITERKQAQTALAYQAMHDSLTDLPNRTLLQDRLHQAVLVAHRHATPVALLLLDLDRFKEVNDTFGHDSGDALLTQVASRLAGAMRESDTVARLGGDEFAVLLPATDTGGAVTAAERVGDALRRPFTVEGHELEVGASIGIAVYPEHGNDSAMLLRRADVAMYAAKRTARGYTVYSPDRDERSSLRLLVTAELRQAIDGNQLLLRYQPKVSLRGDATNNVEALVRWNHPEKGPTSPDQFIPLAEETGLIKPLTAWVLNESLRQQRAWREAGHDVRISVNFSARTLHDPDLLTTVTRLLEVWDTDPSRLIVEITESALMLDPDRALKTLSDLHDAGVWTSIDDFGTGYSSLGYLRRLPVDEIKIDKSFVIDMATNRDDASIVRSVISLGHNLGLHVVAEGVENRRALDMLVEMECDLAQGFFLSKPLAAGDLIEWFGTPRPRLAVVS